MSFYQGYQHGFRRSDGGSVSQSQSRASGGHSALAPSKPSQLGYQGDRPYWRLRKPDLLALAPILWNDSTGLRNLLQELRRRRSRRWNLTLRTHLELRLTEMGQDYFVWPTTEAPIANGAGLHDIGMRSEGVLRASGYKVGRSAGLAARERRLILHEIYWDPLGGDFDPSYLEEWGAPNCGVRLQKLANTIASLTRNAKRRGPEMLMAIQDWESDLAYLKATYYDRRYDFAWPRV